jgi:hypothetical protein
MDIYKLEATEVEYKRKANRILHTMGGNHQANQQIVKDMNKN